MLDMSSYIPDNWDQGILTFDCKLIPFGKSDFFKLTTGETSQNLTKHNTALLEKHPTLLFLRKPGGFQ